jgi:2-hydroxychromene-2-carboxylate isomerase
MNKQVDFIFDFGGPNAYLAHHVMADFKAETGAEINYVPCLLGGIFKATGNQPPWATFAHVKSKLDYETLEMNRFIAKHKLTKFTMNPNFPINTILLMRGAIVAQAQGHYDAYIDAGMRFMWEDGLKMDDPQVYAQAFNEAGLDGAALLEGTQDSAVKEQLAKNTDEAVARGVFGVPTFFVGDEMFFGKERLNQVKEALAAS